jgi:hypothetical protein
MAIDPDRIHHAVFDIDAKSGRVRLHIGVTDGDVTPSPSSGFQAIASMWIKIEDFDQWITGLEAWWQTKRGAYVPGSPYTMAVRHPHPRWANARGRVQRAWSAFTSRVSRMYLSINWEIAWGWAVWTFLALSFLTYLWTVVSR